MTSAVNEGYNFEGIQGHVLPGQSSVSPSEPLFRLFNGGTVDHFYTTNDEESNNAVQNDGYNFEGIQAFVFAQQICGSVPLLRAFSNAGTDHFYTTSELELESAVASGYNSEGIAAFILP